MAGGIAESDWREFKKVHTALEQRFCQNVLDELGAIVHANKGSAYDRYLRAYRLLQKRDKELERGFDDFRRSTALQQLAVMRRMKLLTDEDLAGFSEETREFIRVVVPA